MNWLCRLGLHAWSSRKYVQYGMPRVLYCHRCGREEWFYV